MESYSIMRVSYLYELLLTMWNQSFADLDEELHRIEDSLKKPERDRLISLKNEETNRCARQLISSDGMEGCSLRQKYGVFRRLHNSVEVLRHYDGDWVVFLIDEAGKGYRNPFEYFLLGLELTSGVEIPIYAVPEEKRDGALKAIYSSYVSLKKE